MARAVLIPVVEIKVQVVPLDEEYTFCKGPPGTSRAKKDVPLKRTEQKLKPTLVVVQLIPSGEV
jgi:hypothetical protein